MIDRITDWTSDPIHKFWWDCAVELWFLTLPITVGALLHSLGD